MRCLLGAAPDQLIDQRRFDIQHTKGGAELSQGLSMYVMDFIFILVFDVPVPL